MSKENTDETEDSPLSTEDDSSLTSERRVLTVLWWIMGIAVLAFIVFVVTPFFFDAWLAPGRAVSQEMGNAIDYDKQLIADGDESAWYIRLLKNPSAWVIFLLIAAYNMIGSFSNSRSSKK